MNESQKALISLIAKWCREEQAASVNALVAAGEVSQAEVDRRKKSRR
jgi:hypothetical protein